MTGQKVSLMFLCVLLVESAIADWTNNNPELFGCQGKSCGDSCLHHMDISGYCDIEGECLDFAPFCTNEDAERYQQGCAGRSCGEQCREDKLEHGLRSTVLGRCHADGGCIPDWDEAIDSCFI